MIVLTAATQVSDKRSFGADNFEAADLPSGSHVLVLDDTWVSGGHAQSAGLSLRRAGAAPVSILTMARWLNPKPGEPAGAFIRDRLVSHDFDPLQCPWTGAACPPTGP
jgi:hypothetical protein